MTPFKPTIRNDGLVATHNMPCAVYRSKSAVVDCATEVFHPSWEAQKQGWRLVRATNWLQRLALRVFP